ncbi:seryl-tRNA synthetase, putative [Eimeria tenella]|uniref:serine--tRNA ligase n=1 Tax=Eimeria tenella TaxID=5802 RepID=U6L555_EIMTE|nr:seryl-tRNA synthetase, putative [Eimeria tenella]CDJ44343.1 seryl-tRNA synthetase, putative [Eimeria tenella]|eukprot:XP_013235092.1 seryl-tRNA synthetase, putative [Eimeria tenella]
MTIDINLLREEKGGCPAKVAESERRRGRDPSRVDQLVAADKRWREATYALEQGRKDLNSVNKEIGQRKKANSKDSCEDLVAKTAEIKGKLQSLEAEAAAAAQTRDRLLKGIGNLVHDSVPVSSDEAENKVVKTWGTPNRMKIDGSPGRMHHHEVLARLQGADFKKGVEVAGHRGYYLKGPAVMLNYALIQYGLSFLAKKGYLPVQPPYFIRKPVMAAAAELKDFEETLYRIPHDSSAQQQQQQQQGKQQGKAQGKQEEAERDDMFMIATSEQPLCALHMHERIEEKQLPLRYAGSSTCFRKEAGAHGKDCWGLFRVHQFEKVEQFCITSPEKSWEMHEEMIATAEEFYQSLELPYRVVAIVSGALNDAAAKKYDLEAWFPGYEAYRELVSCSNCTDYQSREFEIRLGHKKEAAAAAAAAAEAKPFVHLLNATLVATQRCICCILENYQTPTGLRVPRALVPYMGGQEFLHYTAEAEDTKREA